MSVFKRLFGTAPVIDATPAETPPVAAPPSPESEVGQLPFGAELLELAGLSGEAVCAPAIRRAAQLRLGRLLEADASLADASLAGLTSESALAALAAEAASPVIRRLAAGRVQEPGQLAALLKAARGRDNTVYRIVKDKRDTLHAQQRAAAEALATMSTLCASIERHIHQPFNGAYVPALEHLARQWSAVADQAPAELQARARTALDRCGEVVTRHLQQLAREAAESAAVEQAMAARTALLQELPTLLASAWDADAADTEASLVALSTRWSTLAEFKHPTRAEAERFDTLRGATASLAAATAQHGSLPQLAAAVDADYARVLEQALGHLDALGDELPESARAAATAVQAWRQARVAESEVAAAALRQVGGLLRKAQSALAAGHSRQAGGIRRALEEKLPDLPVALPAQLASQIQAFDEKLNALQDWRSFAVAPKRVELIERMEALVGAEEKPTELADRIKRLQDEWKLISKGSTEDTTAEWQRFHEAAQKAYEPCREHFAAQAKLRADNLEKRAALLARLQHFVAAQDWQQADWREVSRALRESRPLWRSAQPVERAANKPLQEAFDAVIADLQGRLEAEYTRNADAKRALIARAQQLLTAEDGRGAADEVKRLQQSWKDIGLVSQDESQRLWEEFRQHCDAVFERRQQQHTEFVSQLGANAARATELCAEAEALLTLSGSELVEGARRMPALREAFAAIGDLPKAESNALRNRLERALERCERLLAEQRARDRAAAWDHVFACSDLIRLFRLAIARGGEAGESDARRAEAQAAIDAVAEWPKGTQRMVAAELARTTSRDLAANEVALRQLCIRAELFTGVATPESDHALRRDWQLQRLSKGFGQGRGATPDSQETLLGGWLGAGATEDGVYPGLRARFLHCWQRALNPR